LALVVMTLLYALYCNDVMFYQEHLGTSRI